MNSRFGGAEHQESAAEKLSAGVNYNRYYGHDDVLRSYETDASIRLDFTNRWFVGGGYEDGFQRFEKDYWNRLASLGFGYDNRAGRSFELVVSEGENFGDDLWLYEAAVAFKITDAWNLDYELTYLDLDQCAPDNVLLHQRSLHEALSPEQHGHREGEHPAPCGVADPAAFWLATGRLPARHFRAGGAIGAGQHPVRQAVVGLLNRGLTGGIAHL